MLLIAVALAAPPPPPIINGQPADEDVYPATGAMIIDAVIDYGGPYEYKSVFCSSTLIAPDVVLVAAHCVDEVTLTGGYDLLSEDIGWSRQADLTRWDGSSTPKDWPEDTVMAADWVKHERFSLYQLQMGIAENWDIGLLFLEEAVLDVEPAYLVTAEEAAQIGEGDTVDIVGWGQQVATSGDDMPPKGSFAVKYWGTSVIGEIGEPEFQVGPEKADTRKCHGDSGGPTFMQVETDSAVTTRVIGVTSHAYDTSDCDRAGGVDTRVDHYLAWIDQQMRAACDDGTRVWCDEPGILPPPEPVVDPPDEDSGVAEGKPKHKADGDEAGTGCGCNSGAGAMALPWLGAMVVRRRRSR